MTGASGRIGVHNGNGKRTASALQSSTTSETLGASVKLGQVARDKERKEKEDVELKPPWDLLPYSRDTAAGTSVPATLLIMSRISRLLSVKRNGGGIQTHGKSNHRWL
jgi:hypothetical protein